LAPQAKELELKKPSKVLKSPFGHPLKLKDLVSLNLTPVPDMAETTTTGKYGCLAVTF
jgi:hypothetical protein